MCHPEPHPRRRRAGRRALFVMFASGLLTLGAAAAGAVPAQILPRPTTTTTEPVETTTTTEAVEETTTTEAPTETTVGPTETTSASDDGDDVVVDDEVVPDDVADGDEPAAEDEPAVEAEGLDETTTTGRDVLVAGDGSEGAESTTTSSTAVVEVAAEDDGLDEEAQIWLIVVGLVVVALLIAVWTYKYWARTRPATVEGEPDQTTVFRE